MMIDRSPISTRALTFTAMLLLSVPALAEVKLQGPDKLLREAHLVVILKLVETAEAGAVTEAQILRTVKGKINSDRLRFIYPEKNIEAMWLFTPPRKGTVLLAFLRIRQDGTYAPSSGYRETTRMAEDGTEYAEELYDGVYGNESVKHTTAGNSEAVAALIDDYLRWGGLEPGERSELIRRSLLGPTVTRRIALEWLIDDRKIDFNIRDSVTDEIVEGLIHNVTAEDVRIRQKAILAVGMATTVRRDLVPYLIDALDDQQARDMVINRLDGRRGLGPGPELDPEKTVAAKVRVLREWWRSTGSKNPTFRRFVPGTQPVNEED